MHFFDHNATTPLLPEAKEAWLEANELHWMNPSSPYRAGAAVHAHLENARERLAELLDVDPLRVVFNSGASEGNNFVFASWAESLGAGACIAVGATEHPSVIESAKLYFGDRVQWLQPNKSGVIAGDAVDLSTVSALSLMAANNETGVIHPWQDWMAACREHAILMHCDASQWVGKMPLVGLGRCDYVSACAHKFGGPKGVGFLLVPERVGARVVGGVQENGHRAGTEDVAGILAMLAALEVSEKSRAEHPHLPKNSFLAQIREQLEGVQVIGEGAPILWNTASLELPFFKSTRWIRALEKKGFFVSAGSACSSGKEGPSHVLASMGLSDDVAARVVRISASWQTTAEEWSALLNAILESYRELESEAGESDSRVISI